MAPSLVTCPTRTVAISRSLASGDHRRRDGADLRDRAGRAVDSLAGDGLHGVDDEQAGRNPVDMGQQRAQVVLGGDEQGRMHRAGAFPAQPDLSGRFLPGHDQRRAAASSGVPPGHVEQQGRLADTRLAGQEDNRSGDQPAAQHPVELTDAGRLRPRSLRIVVTDRPGRSAHRPRPRRSDRRPGATLDQRPPRLALRAAAHPSDCRRAALDAAEGRRGSAGSSSGHARDGRSGLRQFSPDRRPSRLRSARR